MSPMVGHFLTRGRVEHPDHAITPAHDQALAVWAEAETHKSFLGQGKLESLRRLASNSVP